MFCNLAQILSDNPCCAKNILSWLPARAAFWEGSDDKAAVDNWLQKQRYFWLCQEQTSEDQNLSEIGEQQDKERHLSPSSLEKRHS